MSKLAFLFPGQGAQYPGMGKELAEKYKLAKETFQEADQILGFKISELILRGDKEELKQTEVTQPAILTVSTACMRVLENEYKIFPDGAAGLSLGEYSALVAADSIDFKTALPLVQKRGKYMQEAVPEGQGKMVAVIGLETDKIEEICFEITEKKEKVVKPVNYNCPGQVVIAGEVPAVDEAVLECQAQKASKIVELAVSAPFHCEMLSPASENLKKELDEVELRKPAIEVLSNVTGERMDDPQQIKDLLTRQVKSPVLWEQSMRKFLELDYSFFIELPPGKTLTSFMRKIERKKAKCKPVEDPEKIEKASDELVEEGIL